MGLFTGHVYNKVNNQPLEGAYVSWECGCFPKCEGYTNGQGEYDLTPEYLTPHPAGHCLIGNASKPGFTGVEVRELGWDGGPQYFDFYLDPVT